MQGDLLVTSFSEMVANEPLATASSPALQKLLLPQPDGFHPGTPGLEKGKMRDEVVFLDLGDLQFTATEPLEPEVARDWFVNSNVVEASVLSRTVCVKLKRHKPCLPLALQSIGLVV